MNIILMLFALLGGGSNQNTFDPATLVTKHIIKGVYDETRVQTLEVNQKKYPHNTVD
jgi:hypothetical protein